MLGAPIEEMATAPPEAPVLLEKTQPVTTADEVPSQESAPPLLASLSSKTMLMRVGEEAFWQRTPPPLESPQQSSVTPRVIVRSRTIVPGPSLDLRSNPRRPA